jgi:hypothetical protein
LLKLYKVHNTDITEYQLLRHNHHHPSTTYANVPYISQITSDDPDLYPVDTYYTKYGISLRGITPNHTPVQQHTTHCTSLQQEFLSLPQSLWAICGTISFPADNGTQLIQSAATYSNTIFGASVASLKENRATHAWVLTTGCITDLCNPNISITGHGIVDGFLSNLSSTREELHGIRALSIMASLLADFHSFKGNIKTVCNNQAVINKCGNLSTGQLKNHWETNFDLYFTQQHYKGTLSTEWVRGHADKSPWFTPNDLILQNLSREEIFNIWSDKIAKHSWNQGAVECLTLTHHP